MPGPPPRQHKHERQYTPSTHSVIPTRRIWNDDYDGQMIFGDLGGLKFPDICLKGEEKPRKIPHPGNLSRPGIEPGPAAWQARMLLLAPQRWTPSKITVEKFKFKWFAYHITAENLRVWKWHMAIAFHFFITLSTDFPLYSQQQKRDLKRYEDGVLLANLAPRLQPQDS